MSDNVIQTSFAGGELSPSLFARVDFAKFRTGAATMRNFFVDYRSGASTRPGLEFIRPGVGSKIRLVRFQQSNNVSYVLEFGNGYLRFVTQGGSVVEPAIAIGSITTGTSTLVALAAGIPNGSMVFIGGGNIPQLANRYYTALLLSGTTYKLLDAVTGSEVNSTGWVPYTGGAVSQTVYTIGTPYLANELSLLKFSQKANTMNITHPGHPPYVLTLISATNWTLLPATFGATVGPPAITAVTPSAGGPVSYKYAVTALDRNNQESVASNVVVTASSVDLRTDPGSIQIVWATGAAVLGYNIYGSPASYIPLSADIGGMGFIGSVPYPVNVFIDSNIAADFSQTPPIHDDPFTGKVFPQCSSYFQQRLVYANGGGNLVQTFWMSKVAAYYNFDISDPPQANDAITAELVGLEVNEIKSMVPMPSGLLMLTSKGVWQVSGGAGGVATQGGPITPQTATATPQAYVGANDVPPILINYDLIFVQSKGSIIRDLAYNIYANIYTGNDISILSSHLFYGHQILEWAYAEEPFKVVWCIREDGILLSLTLVKEQEMYGWARHDTRGKFESVASVTEGTTDATYFAVRRPHPTVPNVTVLQIERMADRTFTFGAEDSFCVDSAVKTISNTPSTGLLITPPEFDIVTLITDDPAFSSDMVGWVVRADGGIMEVTEFIGTRSLRAKVKFPMTQFLPDDPLNRPLKADPGEWSIDKPFTTVFGLDHLEGQQISCLADGGVVNNLVVTGGAVTMPAPVTKVVAGYGYQCQLQTMYLDLGNEAQSVQGKRKKIGALTVRCKDSRGLKAGRTFQTLVPIKELNRTTLMGQGIPLITADERVVMDPLWDVPGQICMQVDDPLPSTVLGVIPEVVLGDSNK